MEVRPHFLWVVLFRAGRGLAMGRSTVHGVLPKCLKGFKVSEVNSEARGRDPRNVQQ